MKDNVCAKCERVCFPTSPDPQRDWYNCECGTFWEVHNVDGVWKRVTSNAS